MYQDISFLTNDHTGDTYVIADDHCRKMASALSVNLGVETQRALNAEAAIDGRIGDPETGAYILGGNTVNQNLKELDAKVAAFSQDIGTALEEYLDENPLPIDDALDTTSENAVQNAPVATAIEALQAQLGEHTVASDVPAGAVFTDTTYTFATGDVNGQIKVTPAGSTAQHISVKGLGSAAYTNTSAYDANGAATAAVTAHNSSATAHGDIRDAMVTGVLMNGERVGTTGLIDLGTVITEHQDISGKLDKAGGIMTGALTLSGAPTENLHAATKAYVDAGLATKMTTAAYDTDNDGFVDAVEDTLDPGSGIEFSLDANGKGQYRAVGAQQWIPFLSEPTYTRLWTNPSPTESFAAQTVSLSASAADYRFLRVVWAPNAADPQPVGPDGAYGYVIIYDMAETRRASIREGGGNYAQLAMSILDTNSHFFARRLCFVENDNVWEPSMDYEHMVISACQRMGASGTSNGKLIPICIDGGNI